VIGLGFMGSTHLKALRAIPDAELVAVCSRDERKLSGDLAGIQGNTGGPGEKLDFRAVEKYRDIRQVLEDTRVEAVDICLPTNLHAPVAVDALRAGKHVLVEKPMALEAPAARQMIAEAKKHDRVLMVAHVLRFFPMYEVLCELLNSGRIGIARSALFRRRCAAPGWSGWLADPAQSGGGVFDLLIHDIDMGLHLFGKPDSISATGHEALASGVDVITAELHYPGRRTVIVSGGWHHPKSYPFSMEYTVVADGGTVEFTSAGRAPTLFHADGRIEPLAMIEKDGYRAEIEYFLACCRERRRPELCTPEESADAVAVARCMLEARNRNGEKTRCSL
ncbi:MAG TPA: Gfo/Idh/MocA family oxidoreductase, partial [Bryobacteraceae bacterium]|nr:Gfo/Idh/MocA family oxidoreductase [Bryobacteraceae bacterium]